MIGKPFTAVCGIVTHAGEVEMSVSNVVVDSRVLGPPDGDPRQASISDDQWTALKGKASVSPAWMWTYRSKDVDEVGSGDLVGATFLLALDVVLASIATILVFYRPL